MTAVLAGMAALLTGIGLAQALVGSRLVASFGRKRREPPVVRPPVTVLKPLYGNEPLLEEALTNLCRQDYADFQIVFGVQDANDPAVDVVRRLQSSFVGMDIALVVDPMLHGRNRKVGNLINMMPKARHDVLVIADADVHVRSDYLDRLVATLQQPRTGLVTVLYAGLPYSGLGSTSNRQQMTLPASLGATQITHGFLPGALLARAFGRQDCLGATMCVRRSDLERVGGFHSLVDHLADDNVLGRRIRALGLDVALADTVVLTTVPEARLPALFRHELRWARTIRALEPVGFAASVLQYPLTWAFLTIILASGAFWSIGFFLIAWGLKAAAAIGVDRALASLWSTDSTHPGTHSGSYRSGSDVAALAFRCPLWLLPLRDVLSVAVMVASYGGRQVDWRGHALHADTPPPFTQRSMAGDAVSIRPVKSRPPNLSPFEGMNTR